MRYLFRYQPTLVDAYAELYRKGSYVTRSYAADLAERSSVLLRKHGLDRKDTMLRIPDTQAAPIPPHLALTSQASFDQRNRSSVATYQAGPEEGPKIVDQ